MIYPDLHLNLTGFFPGEHSIHFLANNLQDFGISFYITAVGVTSTPARPEVRQGGGVEVFTDAFTLLFLSLLRT